MNVRNEKKNLNKNNEEKKERMNKKRNKNCVRIQSKKGF